LAVVLGLFGAFLEGVIQEEQVVGEQVVGGAGDNQPISRVSHGITCWFSISISILNAE